MDFINRNGEKNGDNHDNTGKGLSGDGTIIPDMMAIRLDLRVKIGVKATWGNYQSPPTQGLFLFGI